MLNRFRKPAIRRARRVARIKRWDRPIDSTGERLRAWSNMLFVDHGIFRIAYLNKYKVTPNLWRSAQPAPYQIAALARDGLKTIVNLRGGREHGAWQLQKDYCAKHGIKLVEFIVRSRGAPDKQVILSAKKFFDELEYPALIHCKSGADRAGFVAALFLIVHEGRPVSEAISQLSLKYGHFRFAKTGILDAFFEMYLKQGEANGIPFLEWVEKVYDPKELERNFRPSFWSDLLVDGIMHRE
ncbi:tyrosine-protein phosphatase [Microvirga sp. W0021]|uniref:Tyrosine-protein phosphatase n=1 Tax=Hohaiivirga grylli TaxID=3133970 RepID=A0ABV0BH17_9HYPH